MREIPRPGGADLSEICPKSHPRGIRSARSLLWLYERSKSSRRIVASAENSTGQARVPADRIGGGSTRSDTLRSVSTNSEEHSGQKAEEGRQAVLRKPMAFLEN